MMGPIFFFFFFFRYNITSLSVFLSNGSSIASYHIERMIASLKGNEELHLSCSSTFRDVNYNCGSCDFELHLNSTNRLIDDSNYGKSINTSIISFFSVDESRFIHKLQQFPLSLSSWLYFFTSNNRQRSTRTKLLCRNCGVHLGYARGGGLPSESWDGISDSRIFYIKLNALQPSFYDDQPTLANYHSASSPSLVFSFYRNAS